jgi:hypothetical protein
VLGGAPRGASWPLMLRMKGFQGIGSEVGEQPSHALRTSVDLDLGMQLLHRYQLLSEARHSFYGFIPPQAQL